MRNVLFLLLLPVCTLGQKKDTVFRYLDEKLNLTKKEAAVFFGVSVRRDDHWQLFAVYPDTTPVLSAYYKDKQLSVKDGRYTVFYPKNKMAVDGYYVNNQKMGVWQSWYENGQRKDSGQMVGNRLVNEWKTWHENGNLQIQAHYTNSADLDNGTTSRFLSAVDEYSLKEGSYRSWYLNGSLESTGDYHLNQMSGEWQWFYENGQPSTKETYQKGKITAMQCFDSTGKLTGDFCSILKPPTVVDIGDFFSYIKENLTWPEEALKKRLNGIVKVRLSITKTGKLQKLEINCTEPLFQKAVADMFSKFKGWYPAVSHNRPIDWSDEFEIPFKMND